MGTPHPALCSPPGSQGQVPGYRGFHWCVRPLYTWELKEIHCSSRKLLPSGGHSWGREGGGGGGRLGGTRPTKAFLSRPSRKWLPPRWPLLSASHRLALGRSGDERKDSDCPSDCPQGLRWDPVVSLPPGSPGPAAPSVSPAGGAEAGPRAEGSAQDGRQVSLGAHERPGGQLTLEANTEAVATWSLQPLAPCTCAHADTHRHPDTGPRRAGMHPDGQTPPPSGLALPQAPALRLTLALAPPSAARSQAAGGSPWPPRGSPVCRGRCAGLGCPASQGPDTWRMSVSPQTPGAGLVSKGGLRPETPTLELPLRQQQ